MSERIDRPHLVAPTPPTPHAPEPLPPASPAAKRAGIVFGSVLLAGMAFGVLVGVFVVIQLAWQLAARVIDWFSL